MVCVCIYIIHMYMYIHPLLEYVCIYSFQKGCPTVCTQLYISIFLKWVYPTTCIQPGLVEFHLVGRSFYRVKPAGGWLFQRLQPLQPAEWDDRRVFTRPGKR